VGGTRTDGACCDNAKDGGEDIRNEEKDGKEWGEEDGKKQEKKEERSNQPKKGRMPSASPKITSNQPPTCSGDFEGRRRFEHT